MEIRSLATNMGSDINSMYQGVSVAQAPIVDSQKNKTSADTESVSLSAQSIENAKVSGAVDNLAVALEAKVPNLAFSLNEKDGRVLVQITDNETKKVIKQIPSKEILELSERLDKIIKDLTEVPKADK